MIIINGEKHENPKTLDNLIKILKINKKHVVIFINGKIINKKDWKNIIINENDNIEIITLVGGG